jgi:hypothetical protein
MMGTRVLQFFLHSKSSSHATHWISGLITQLLQVTHIQWIYQCILVHDRTIGTLISAHKEELLKEIDRQLTLGLEGLAEEDRFLLECNFDSLTTTTGKHREYWLHSGCQRRVTHMQQVISCTSATL